MFERTISRAVRKALDGSDVAELAELRQKIEALKIEKARREEEFATREREIQHKVGLERERQKFEREQAKREAVVEVQEKNLEAERTRARKEIQFHEERLTKEVNYLKEIMKDILKRLPSAEIIANK